MNAMLIIGVLLNWGIVFLIGASGEYSAITTTVMGVFAAISVVGAVLILAGQRKVGILVAIFGCLAFTPIGLIGAIGARKLIRNGKTEEFE